MSAVRPELFGAAQRVLDYLGYAARDRLLITADTAGDQAVVQALAAAALAAGGKPVMLCLPQLPYQGKLADPYLPEPLEGAAGCADLWIDLTFPYIAGSALHDRVMKRGAVRYLLASDLTGAALQRLFAGVDLDRYFDVLAGFDALFWGAVGQTARVTTPRGTDVSFTLAQPGLVKPRRAQAPGLYLIPGAATLTPEIETVRGRIVLETVFHEFYTRLDAPIVLEVDGRIRSVTGGGAERATLERALRRAGGGGGEYGYVIHFTHGLHPAARFTGRCFVEDMRVKGSDAVGLGLPWWQDGGGENHPDAVLSMQSLWIAGSQIVADGAIVAPRALADRAAALL
jgi:2,5-dihydroxypyridine 5,6-dioxygenase